MFPSTSRGGSGFNTRRRCALLTPRVRLPGCRAPQAKATGAAGGFARTRAGQQRHRRDGSHGHGGTVGVRGLSAFAGVFAPECCRCLSAAGLWELDATLHPPPRPGARTLLPPPPCAPATRLQGTEHWPLRGSFLRCFASDNPEPATCCWSVTSRRIGKKLVRSRHGQSPMSFSVLNVLVQP